MVPGLILAAGQSSRMGRPKALLTIPPLGVTFVRRLAAALRNGMSDPMNAPVRGPVEELQRLLANLNEQGRFAASVLTDGMGLPIASAAESSVEEGQAAVAALVQVVAGRIRERLNLSETDEVSFFDSSGRRLVCRLFTAGVPHGEIMRSLTLLAEEVMPAFRA